MLAVYDRDKKLEVVSFETSLCKALGWFFPLLAKFRVTSVEELVFRKFPYVCPYCRERPHVDARCKTIRGTSKTVDHDALRGFYDKNKTLWPVTLNDWQEMFQKVYPRSTEDRPGRSTLGLLEELGELAEAVRVFERYPKYFAGEAADVFSYIMGLANEHSLRLEKQNRVFSFEEEFLKRYPGLCVHCGYSVCICPFVPEATVGRLAKELDLAPVDKLFYYDEEVFRREALTAAGDVFDRLGGYMGVLDNLPFDRGETNRTLVLLCLKLAENVQDHDAHVAQQLRTAAIKVATAVTYAGSRRQNDTISPIIRGIQKALSEVQEGAGISAIATEASLSGQIGRHLRPDQMRLLLVLANPDDTTSLRLAEEQRAINEAIALSKAKDAIRVRVLPAATADDLRRALLDSEYDIVHFSGHGEPGVFKFETVEGGTQHSRLHAIASLFSSHVSIKCVIFNACWSLKDFDIPVAPITVGMEAPVDDEAAISFARGFYDALGAHRDLVQAIKEGCDAAALKDQRVPIKVLSASKSTS